MRKIMLAAALLVLIGGGIAVAATTSDDVAKHPARADCPGVIECPLTGEPICADECPLNDEGAGEVPSCCRKAK